jgi:hypothetical protein
MEFTDLQEKAFDGNFNNPEQANISEFEYFAIKDIFGSAKSRAAVKENISTSVKKVSNAAVKPLEKVPGLSKLVGTEKSRSIVSGKIQSAVKTIGMAPMRAAFLGLLRINAFNIAYALKKQKDSKTANWNTIRNTKWAKFGGNRTELDSVVDKGSKVKAPLGLKFKKTKGADGSDYLEVSGETAALIASAAPIVVAIMSALGKNSDVQMDQASANDIAAQAAAESASTAEAQAVQDQINAEIPESEISDTENNMFKYILIGTGVLAVIGLTIWLIKRKK